MAIPANLPFCSTTTDCSFCLLLVGADSTLIPWFSIALRKIPITAFRSRMSLVSVATNATSGALASSRDALRADSDLRAYGPCHRRDGTADTPELLPQLSQPDLGTISDDYGPAAIRRSMDLAAAAGASATRKSQDRSNAVRRDRRLRDRRERADASVREHGTRRALQVNSTRHALGIYYSD